MINQFRICLAIIKKLKRKALQVTFPLPLWVLSCDLIHFYVWGEYSQLSYFTIIVCGEYSHLSYLLIFCLERVLSFTYSYSKWLFHKRKRLYIKLKIKVKSRICGDLIETELIKDKIHQILNLTIWMLKNQ